MAFQHASPLNELPPNSMRAVSVASTPVLLVREGDQVYALEPRCGHAVVFSSWRLQRASDLRNRGRIAASLGAPVRAMVAVRRRRRLAWPVVTLAPLPSP